MADPTTIHDVLQDIGAVAGTVVAVGGGLAVWVITRSVVHGYLARALAYAAEVRWRAGRTGLITASPPPELHGWLLLERSSLRGVMAAVRRLSSVRSTMEVTAFHQNADAATDVQTRADKSAKAVEAAVAEVLSDHWTMIGVSAADVQTTSRLFFDPETEDACA